MYTWNERRRNPCQSGKRESKSPFDTRSDVPNPKMGIKESV